MIHIYIYIERELHIYIYIIFFFLLLLLYIIIYYISYEVVGHSVSFPQVGSPEDVLNNHRAMHLVVLNFTKHDSNSST